LEETLEADISTWQKTGHFYFALTAFSSRERQRGVPEVIEREKSSPRTSCLRESPLSRVLKKGRSFAALQSHHGAFRA
jgi:hypothetical protein